ncbi:helix-turn-helix domain-containing protein [Paenibacillus ehimensis]|uniref:helix-turn-helix domain-containing protein n=1 Tax=Paenibacillus ehimensis TaxID=79264 RepID=UPI00046ECE17|nr:helix-turn-helix transcriptional regulator [Paenibacillus ehimensis]
MNENFGSFLKRKREDRGYTLVQLAEASGISIAQLSRLENGLRDTPKPETVKKLAHALEVSLVEMMVLAGYWDQEELLHPIEGGKVKGDSAAQNAKDPDPITDSEPYHDIHIEDLVKHNLSYNGHQLTEEQKQHLMKILLAAAELLGEKK